MKGLILSGGKGTRLRPLTYTRAKQLLPLANKPVLFYAIEALIEAGITDIAIIVGDTHIEIEEAVSQHQWGPEVHISFIQQEAPLGLAHAVKIAQEFMGDDRFVMFLGDNLIGESLTPIIKHFNAPESGYHCNILLTEVPDPTHFGVAEVESITDAGNLRVKRLVEKPKVPPSNLALVGVYLFDSSIFTAVNAIQPSPRGELEITDAIQWLLEHGYDVRAQKLSGYWIDTGKMEDILDANRQILMDIEASIHPDAFVSDDSSLSGVVVLQKGARIENSVVRGPAIIGENTVIRNAYIGPFTSVYHDARVENSEVEFSILLEHSVVEHVRGRIEESLIGRYAEVQSIRTRPHGHKLMLGDHSRTNILPSNT